LQAETPLTHNSNPLQDLRILFKIP